jgi:hypothetical protein
MKPAIKVAAEILTSRTLKRFAVGSLAAALALGGATRLQWGLAKAAQNPESEDRGLQGTWRVTAQPFVCGTDTKIGHPFTSLLTFAQGGTLSESTGNPAFLPGQRTPGLGVWSRTGSRHFKAVFEGGILFDSTAPPYLLLNPPPPSSPNFHRGSQRISQTFIVNGDELASDGTVQFLDPSGKVLSKLCASSTGQRLELEDE